MNSFPPTTVSGRSSATKEIDFSLRFMPEELTPLCHTSVYGSLTEIQRLRYNQIHALYFNEQTLFFEKALARNVLGYFLAQPATEELKSGLRQFMLEEERHSAMFRDLNRKCAPEIYAKQDFHFIRVAPAAARILDFISRQPNWFPLLLWLMHLQEERALFFGRVFMKSADDLEPHFVAAQRKHLADEVGHVRWDEALLDWVWPKTRTILRHGNVRIFAWMIGEFFSAPKRSALRVMEALVGEFPELQPQYRQLCRQLCELGNNPAYRCSLYCAENVPGTFRRFDRWPEFYSLRRVMPGYVPGTHA